MATLLPENSDERQPEFEVEDLRYLVVVPEALRIRSCDNIKEQIQSFADHLHNRSSPRICVTGRHPQKEEIFDLRQEEAKENDINCNLINYIDHLVATEKCVKLREVNSCCFLNNKPVRFQVEVSYSYPSKCEVVDTIMVSGEGTAAELISTSHLTSASGTESDSSCDPTWQWMSDNFEWAPYGQETVSQIEAAFQQNKTFVTLTKGHFSNNSTSDRGCDYDYKINLRERTQQYHDTQRKRDVRRLVTASHSFDGLFHDGTTTEIRSEDAMSALHQTAKSALQSANLKKSLSDKIEKARVDMELGYDGHELHCYVTSLTPLATHHDIEADDSIEELIMKMLKSDLNDTHSDLIDAANHGSLVKLLDSLVEFVRLSPHSSSESNLLLKQERAILILADCLWALRDSELRHGIQITDIVAACTENIQTKERLENAVNKIFTSTDDDAIKIRESHPAYMELLEHFLKASNEKELLDYEKCAKEILRNLKLPSGPNELRMRDLGKTHVSSSGMRVGISSANASDNWTNAKLSGGVVLNVSVNLNNEIPLRASFRCIEESCIVLISKDSMTGKFQRTAETYGVSNASELFEVGDPADVLRMLKYGLVFCGIINENCRGDPSGIIRCVERFTGGCGVELSITNLGPSRSGFASSSAVALNILKVLYKASGQDQIGDDQILLGSMALLFENQLGLKSGRQDVDGLLPNGIKFIDYLPTDGFVVPTIKPTHGLEFDALPEHLIMVNSGIARAAGLGLHRGLNVRHWAYLSRDKERFEAIQKSVGIHKRIVKAVETRNYPLLGRLFTQYMALRETIDPGATRSIFDEEMGGEKVLRRLFDPFVEDGLIYGGMFTGAMGGGVAMLVLTSKGISCDNGTGGLRKIDIALNELKTLTTPAGRNPYGLLNIINYSVNTTGIHYEHETNSFEDITTNK